MLLQANTEKGRNKYWIELCSAPLGVMWNGDMTMINDYEFIIASDCKSDGYSSGIYKFNILNNKWHSFIKYPDKFESFNHRIVYNNDDNNLYLYGSNGTMTVINILNLNKLYFKSISDCSLKNVVHPCLVNINGIIHIIGGLNNCQHLIWSNQHEKFYKIHDFNQQFAEIGYSSIVYSSRIKSIILIKGGVSSNTNTVCSKIWIYSLQTMRWSIINEMEIPFWNINIVLTSDQYNLIISGGCDGNGNISDRIYVLNIEQYNKFTLNISNITCPKPKWHHIMRTGGINDKILVIRWIKRLFATTPFIGIELPPIYIMQLIANWFSTEIIHWLERNGNDHHYGISVKRILSSISS